MTFNPALGFEVGARICKALGLEPENVARLVIEIACDDVAKVYVQQYLDRSQVDGLTDALRPGPDFEVIDVDRVGVSKEGYVTYERKQA